MCIQCFDQIEFRELREVKSKDGEDGEEKSISPFKWKPSISYKHTLEDIKNQFTPAEHYRHQLATVGKKIRQIQRLEQRYKSIN